MMPEMTGIEFIERIRNIEMYRNVPVIVITGDSNDIQNIDEHTRVILKPVNHIALQNAICDII
jgi:CheY-like chemotaxis protein